MTETEIENLYEKMKEIFGDKLPNPEHYPNTFLYYYKLYKYFDLKND